MLYHAYIDDSADGKRERVIVAGAIIGSRTEWGMLNSKWRIRLEADELDYFKSAHCEALREQFHKFRDHGMAEGKKLALQVRDDVYEILRNAPLMMLGVTLSVPFHRVMLSDPEKFGKIPAVPYRLAFQQLLAECAKAMILLGHNNIVTFAHDDGDDFDALRGLYREFKRLNPKYASRMMDFVPLDDKVHPPVQAADVAARMTYKFITDFHDNGRVVTAENIIPKSNAHMYKIVNWLDNPQPYAPDFATEQAPAKAVYAP